MIQIFATSQIMVEATIGGASMLRRSVELGRHVDIDV